MPTTTGHLNGIFEGDKKHAVRMLKCVIEASKETILPTLDAGGKEYFYSQIYSPTLLREEFKLRGYKCFVYMKNGELQGFISLKRSSPMKEWEMYRRKSRIGIAGLFCFFIIIGYVITACASAVILFVLSTILFWIGDLYFHGNHLRHFYVSKRGKGIGSKLWKRLVTYMRENKIRKITCNSSLHALPIYVKFGFEKVGKTQRKHGLTYVPLEWADEGSKW